MKYDILNVIEDVTQSTLSSMKKMKKLTWLKVCERARLVIRASKLMYSTLDSYVSCFTAIELCIWWRICRLYSHN